MSDADDREHNPYAAPLTSSQPEWLPVELGSDHLFQPCPQCQSNDVAPVPYNPMRGRAGPRAVDHMRCKKCGAQFNGRTGESIDSRLMLNWLIPLILILVAVAFFSLPVVIDLMRMAGE